mgnify:CR=1 FL=1
MSEYQYYEFLAVDRPLTTQEMAALRERSSRAHITPVSFSNSYNWGDLKGDPREWMKRYFDLHVYVANWRTAIFMLRLPRHVFDSQVFHAFTADGVFEVEATPSHRVLVWALEESEDDDPFVQEGGAGWMARLAPLREELLRGDLRCLYIGWLAAVSQGLVDEGELEPMAVEGLGNLSAAQQALAEFLEVDVDLLAGVGLADRVGSKPEPAPDEVERWLAALPSTEVMEMLRLLLCGQGAQAERALKAKFAEWRRGLYAAPEAPLRPVRVLWQAAEKARELRLRREEKEREQAAAERRIKRQEYLASLAKDFPRIWRKVGKSAERGSGPGYDEACSLLADLAAAYGLHASRATFDQELRRFMANHLRRKALVQRLENAGLWRGI